MAEERIKAAEAAVLACALLDEDAFYYVCSALKVKDFLDPRNQIIFQAMNDIFAKTNTAPDAVSLKTYLETGNKLASAGGEAYISKILENIPASNDVSSYINQVVQASQLYSMKETLTKLLDKVNKGITDVPSFLGETQKSISEIIQTQNFDNFQGSRDVIESYLDKLDKRIEERRITGRNNPLEGISSGYEILDKYTRGFSKGNLVILAARPSVGKTAFAINIASNVAKRGIPVAFFSLEMRADQIMGRLLTDRSGINQDTINALNYIKKYDDHDNVILLPDKTIKIGNSSVRDLTNFQNAINGLNRDPIYIDDNPGTTVVSIQSELKKFQSQHSNLGLVIIDYLQLINSASGKVNGNDNRTNIVGDISRALKGMARDLNVPVLALAQLSRAVDSRPDHKPTMSDLRDSGSIEQDADMVMMLYREDYYKKKDDGKGGDGQVASGQDESSQDDSVPSNVTLILAKNRNGRTGEISFSFQKDVCHFNAIDEDLSASLENQEQEPVSF